MEPATTGPHGTRATVATGSSGGRWEELATRVLAGEAVRREEALAILTAPDEELLQLLAAAFRIRYRYYGNRVRLNFLINAKSGLCPEDCHYCSQSAVSTADIARYPLLPPEEVLARAEQGVRLRAGTCCIVLSGRRPTRRELLSVAEAVRAIKARHPGLTVCACMGLLTEEEARLLKEAGVDRYNHNLNTAEAHYSAICSTHTYHERVETVRAVAAAGISPCAGVIVGMGESLSDLVDVAFALRELGADSIPVNFLIPIRGTPLAGGARLGPGPGGPPLDPRFALKVLCLFRFVCPDREIRVSAGREVHLRSLQPLALYPANALFVADYLTEPGQPADMDWQMIEDLGFEIE